MDFWSCPCWFSDTEKQMETISLNHDSDNSADGYLLFPRSENSLNRNSSSIDLSFLFSGYQFLVNGMRQNIIAFPVLCWQSIRFSSDCAYQ